MILKSDTTIHVLAAALVVLTPKSYGKADTAKYHICYCVSNPYMKLIFHSRDNSSTTVKKTVTLTFEVFLGL